MPLVIEDGTQVPNADSYITLADARTYAANYGLVLNTDDTVAEVQLRQAYSWITTYYERRLTGYRVGTVQTGALPRNSMYNVNTQDYIANNAIPVDFQQAQVQIAAGVESGVDLNQIKTDQDLKSFEVVGVYKEEYQDGTSTITRPQFSSVSDKLYPYTKAAISGNRLYKANYGYI